MTETNRDSYRSYIAEHIRHEVSLLFQRFNYFLLMTSFLIVAFVTLITSKGLTLPMNYSSRLFWIATTIAAAGFFLSYSFSVVNWMNARLIHEMGSFLGKVEHGYSTPSFTFYVSHVVRQHRFSVWYFFTIQYHLWASYLSFARLGSAETDSAHDLAPHTWIVPMFFAIVWVFIYPITFFDIQHLPSSIQHCLQPVLTFLAPSTLDWLLFPALAIILSILTALVVWPFESINQRRANRRSGRFDSTRRIP